MDRMIDLRKSVDCPWCKQTLIGGGMLNADERQVQPKGGDIVMCYSCGKFSLYVGTAELRKPLYEEFQEITKDPDVLMLWLAWKYTKRK